MRNKTVYEQELQDLKDWDEVQYTTKVQGYDFIVTAGHGYLVVPRSDPRCRSACNISHYGFKGKLAVYLEEDSEAPAFLKGVTTIKATDFARSMGIEVQEF